MTEANNEGKPEAVHVENGTFPQFEPDDEMSAGRYIATRLSTLKPPMTWPDNPFKLLGMLSRQNWLFFAVGMFGWTWDSFDFFSVSLTVTPLAISFERSVTDITWGITLVLMLRTVGSTIFGLVADRYGRKWPFIVNNVLFIALELATGFCQTYEQFLACRALFGIAMGGMYGNAVVTALEDCPLPARGIMSGILQVGYVLGYLLATVFARGLVGTTAYSWRPLYWFGACPPILIILFRLCLPENKSYLEREAIRKANGHTTKTFLREIWVDFIRHWKLLIYMVLLVAGINFETHGTQDLYPTLLTNQYNFSADAVTITQVVANLGAFFGGIVVSYLSQTFGRRLSIIGASVLAGVFLYPYTFVSTKAIMAPAFFAQFFLEGAIGVLPIHLSELSPGSLRTFAVGTAYQLGNLASSASSTIEARLGERFPLSSTSDGVQRYDYGTVICIFTACALGYDIILAFIGPEKRGASLNVAEDADMQKAIGNDDIRDKVPRQAALHDMDDIEAGSP